MTREEWLQERKSGIGGSDAAAIIGLNPYKTNIDLWEEKRGIKEAADISDKSYVKYGIAMEDILRQSFSVKHPEYEIIHEENSIIRHPKYPFLFASLDGILVNLETGEKGILEIKTSEILRSMQKEKWKGDNIPPNYYCQVLHYMNVTGYTFARLFAELIYDENYQVTKTYTIDINDENVKEDLKALQDAEIRFWKYVEDGETPPLVLPNL